jgi:signal transduction histidine kinase
MSIGRQGDPPPSDAEPQDLERKRRRGADAGRRKDEFLRAFAHELRNPLNAILGWAHLLRDGTLDATDSARGVEIICRHAEAQGRLISDALEFSGIVQGTRLHVEPVDLRAILEGALASLRPAAEARQVRLSAAHEGALSPLEADAARLVRIIDTLLDNAVKFTPPGGTIQVRSSGADSWIEVAVADSGRGIPPRVLPRIFDGFRHDGQRGTRGLGLHLAIAQRLAELHGGVLEAASSGEGHGATFTLRLPRRAPSG